ncbi:5_t:CDS:2, partial [Diversispora eburnea]
MSINSTPKCPKWSQLLQQSHKKNYKNVVFVQMTNLRRNGQPSLHNLRFLDFLEDDPKYLLFLMPFNDNNLHGDVKSCPTVQLN